MQCGTGREELGLCALEVIVSERPARTDETRRRKGAYGPSLGAESARLWIRFARGGGCSAIITCHIKAFSFRVHMRQEVTTVFLGSEDSPAARRVSETFVERRRGTRTLMTLRLPPRGSLLPRHFGTDEARVRRDKSTAGIR